MGNPDVELGYSGDLLRQISIGAPQKFIVARPGGLDAWEHIGNIKFEPVDMNNSIATMGILIGDYNWRGKGVASEVLISCSNWLYKNKNINKIILGVDKKNISAINAYKKSNFVKCITYPKDNKIIRMIRYHNISKKIVIGTAQIGNRYGIANKSNKLHINRINCK